MKPDAPPLERFYELDRLGQGGAEIAIALKQDDLARLADWAKVDAVEHLTAKVQLSRLAQNRFKLDYAFQADIVQACVVTLEPVRSHLACEFTREFSLTSTLRQIAEAGGATFAATDEEGPEEIASPHFDLAGPLLEEFLLAIDPYPRAPGAAFDVTLDPDVAPANPFAVLKSLKKGS